MSAAGMRDTATMLGELSRLEGAERAAYLERIGEPALRAELESLLGHLRDAGGFLEQGFPRLAEPSPAPEEEPEETLAPGTLVARYRVRSVLGRGGMGVVYLAEQENPRREVALKVVRTAIASPSILRRFQREAQALGGLQHPGIVQVFEAGAAEMGAGGGPTQPFLAMEYVAGGTLLEHVGRRRAGAREVLGLMGAVCDAVQHAHERGVVHRDLKPGNILVDGDGRPKVLDFGVARALGGGPATLATEPGQFVGTLAYMSPEQVGGRGERVDARSDVYALGVVLYEALSGRPPHDLSGVPLPEAARIIREEAPARLGVLDRSLRGDVETIVARAMDKDPSRRYASAAELGADLRRHLAGAPIAARQDSALYILQKRVRRYRWAVAAGAAAALAVALVAARSAAQARSFRELAASERAAKQEAVAAERARAAELRNSELERARLMSQTGDPAEAESLLWRVFAQDPGSEPAYWALWEHYARTPCLLTFGGGEPLAAACFGAPGRVIACRVGGGAGAAQVYELESGRAAGSFALSPGTVACVPVEGGARVVTLTRSRLLEVRDTLRGGVVASRRLVGGRIPLAAAAGLVATGGSGAIRLWRLPDLAEAGMVAWPVEQGGPDSVALSGDGRLLAGAGGPDHAVRVWDLASPGAAPRELRGHVGSVRALAFSGDGASLASGGLDWTLRVWDLGVAQPEARVITRDQGAIRTVAFLRGDRHLAVRSSWGIWLADPRAGVPLRDLGNHREPVAHLAVSADGMRLLSAGEDGTLKLWDLGPDLGEGPHRWLAAPPPTGLEHAELNTGAPSPDGSRIATVSSAGGVEVWDTRGALLHAIPGPRVAQYDAAFDAEGRLVATAASDGVVRVWAPGAASPGPRELRGHGGVVNCVRFSPAPAWRVASCADDSTVRLWDARDGSCERVIRVRDGDRGAVTRLRFAPDGSYVAAVCEDVLGLWDCATGEPLAAPPTGGDDLFSLDVSPDGRLLAVGTRRRSILLLDVRAGSVAGELAGHTELPWNLAFSPDGRRLLSATSAGVLKLWDVPTRRCLATFRDTSAGWILPVAFVPNSTLVLLGHQHRGASLYDLGYFDRHIRGNRGVQDPARDAGEPAIGPARARDGREP